MKLRERLTEPVDAASVVWFRIAFGALMAIECVRYLAFGWVHEYWIEPSFHFKYLGFSWVEPWPGIGMVLHFALLTVLALALTLGARTRIAAGLFTAGFAYVFLLDQAQYLNHFYAVILFGFLLTIAPTDGDASLDARRDPSLRSTTVPAWALWSLRAQMAFIYLWGGVAKLNADWLQGQPLTMWLRASEHLPELMKGSAGLYLSWAGAGFDLLIVGALLWRRTRAAAVVCAIVFHLANAWMFHIGVFPWLSIAATMLFLAPDHKVFTSSLRRFRVAASPATPRLSAPVAACLAVWLFTQVTLPLRPFVYPTHAHWTDDGHRFSWRMKLRSKTATGTFWIQEPGSRARVRIDPDEHLTQRQRSRMLSRPDMILQYAHYLARLHGPGTQVYAQVFASLNGRAPALLTDHDVDLANEPRNLSPNGWVLPFRDTAMRGVADAQDDE